MPTLNWIGKDKVVNHHLDVPFRTLEKQYTFAPNGGDGDGNMIIHGDNLDALKALLPMYEGRVKCIYIDPPYNTGNEKWVYNDNVNDPHIKAWLGKIVGAEGEDLSRHDKWLCMMYPRLKLLQKLLHPTNGSIFISIDENEVANLKLICNEIFGSNHHVATIAWQKRYSRENRGAIGDAHEYILIYASNVEVFKNLRHKVAFDDNSSKVYKNPNNDPKGRWRAVPMTAQGFRPNQMYPITTPSGVIHYPPNGRCWSTVESEYKKLLEAGRIYFGKNGDSQPSTIRYLSEVEGMVPWTWWPHEEVGHTDEAKKEIISILGDASLFDTPKPTRLIDRILHIATDPNDIILDSFAGSGTTAHAILNMNKRDGGHRKFILVEMGDYAENITAERVRRVINGYGEDNKAVEGTGGGFSFYELGDALLINGMLNPNAAEEKIRAYVYYTETRCALPAASENEKYLLGVHENHAYYFYYEADRMTTLNRAFLQTIQTRAEGYLIYADSNTLSAEDMARFHITFKKIPRDIAAL